MRSEIHAAAKRDHEARRVPEGRVMEAAGVHRSRWMGHSARRQDTECRSCERVCRGAGKAKNIVTVAALGRRSHRASTTRIRLERTPSHAPQRAAEENGRDELHA